MSDDTSDMTSYAVLYVDDEEKALKYFRRAVAEEAMPVHTASSVSEALSLLESYGSEIGVLVTDQRMPGQTGVDLLRRVREDWPDIVRLLTTAYSDLDEAIDAVNRGEIFRYITKPWDIRQLRAELHQAMEVHQLRLERSLLMREKLSVWQRLVEVNRIRDLVVMAGSFTHIRNATAAVAAYLADNITDNATGSMVEPEQLDLWSLTESEIRRTLGLVDTLIRNTVPESTQADFATEITPRQLIEDAAPVDYRVSMQGGDGLPPLLVDGSLAHMLVASLCRMSAGSDEAAVEVLCEPGELQDAGTACVLTFRRPTGSQVPAGTADGLDLNPEPLGAYLIAFHHGGRLQPLTKNDVAHGYRVILPTDPAAAPEQQPESDWLEGILSQLERWS